MLEKIFFSSNSTPSTRWNGLKGMDYGILTTTSCSCADGESDYQSQIFLSPTLHFGSKFGDSPLRICLKKLEGI